MPENLGLATYAQANALGAEASELLIIPGRKIDIMLAAKAFGDVRPVAADIDDGQLRTVENSGPRHLVLARPAVPIRKVDCGQRAVRGGVKRKESDAAIRGNGRYVPSAAEPRNVIPPVRQAPQRGPKQTRCKFLQTADGPADVSAIFDVILAHPVALVIGMIFPKEQDRDVTVQRLEVKFRPHLVRIRQELRGILAVDHARHLQAA